VTAILNRPTNTDVRFGVDQHDPERARVTHLATGLYRDYYGTVPANLEPDFRALVMHYLDHPGASPDNRTRATQALVDFDMVEAECNCGGYLTYIDRRLVHVNVCQWCVRDPEACGFGHSVKRVCDSPTPRQCAHGQCITASAYAESRACGMDLDCCGRHECDTALTA